MGSDPTSPFALSYTAPKITPEFDSITIEARGVDSSGYAQVSEPITVELVDTVKPSIVNLDPAGSGKVAPGRETVRVQFSEYIAPESVNQDNFRIFDADNNAIELNSITQIEDGTVVELNFDPLEIGEYRIEIIAEGIADLSGNTLGTEAVVNTFSVEPAKVTTLFVGLSDIDRDKEGLQVLDNASFVTTANVSEPDGTSISQVEFLIDGEVVNTDTNKVFSYSNTTPKITSSTGETIIQTLQARGVDDRGNLTYTDAVEIEIVDVTPPRISSLNPSNASTVGTGRETVRIGLSEAITAETVNSDNFKVFDTDNNLLEPVKISQLDDGKTVELTFAPLTEGDYRLEVSAENITDISGNALGALDLIYTFSVEPARVTSLYTNLGDIDPEKKGIQAYENTRFYSSAGVVQPSGGSISKVDFLINDEVIATDSRGWSYNSYLNLPKVTPEVNTATIIARGTNNNGELSYTEAVQVELIDATAPTITQTNLDSALIAPGLETVRIDFSEYIVTEVINSDNFQIFDTNNNLLVPLSIEQKDDGKSVELTFAPLEAGEYRLEISAENVVDVSGNVLGTENIVRTFSVQPATVTTLENSVNDIDPEQEGIQAYDESGSYYFKANISEPNGTNIEQVDFLLNDEVVATDTNGSTFSTYIDLPKITSEFNTATIVARGTDNNGDFSYTKPIEIELVDITLPTITQSSPANSAIVAPRREKVRVDFSEYIAAESINSDNFNVFDSNNNLLEPNSIEQVNNGESVELTFSPLELGEYRLEIVAVNITDLSGNAIGTENIVNTFSVETAKVTTLTTDIVDADPDEEGIQDYEYSRVYLRANISEPNGTNIEQVEFLLNDEVIATDNFGNTFTSYVNLPEITPEADTATLVARGTDADGNVTFTNVVEVDLVNIFLNPALYSADVVTDNLDFQANTSEFDFLNLVSISGNKPFKQPDYINVGEPQPTTLLAQLNEDEIGDRVTLNDDGTFSVEIGNSDGSFEPAVNYNFNYDYIGGEGEYIADSVLITAGDVDNDGKDDVLIAFQKSIIDETQLTENEETINSYLTVFLGQGDGTVSPRPYYYTNFFSQPYGNYPESFVPRDVENDAITDWIAFDRDELEVRPLRSNLENRRLFSWTQSLNTDPEYIAVGDFVDRYISQDVIGTDSTKTQLELVSYYTTSNDFDIFRVYDEDSRAKVRRSTHTLNNPSDYIAVEDLDGDNRYDWITVPSDRSQVNIYLKNFDGSNKSENTITFDTETPPSSVNMGDINEDGNYDLLAVYEETGDFFAYFGNGDGTFAEPIAFNLPGEYDSPILRDLDGDGDEDLIAVTDDSTSGNKTFFVFKNDSSGNYAEPFSYTFNDNSSGFVLKDLDGDGDEDLVGVNSFDNRITVVSNQDNTSFGSSNSYDLDDFDYLSFQDLDGDGDLDLLTSTENQRSFSLLFNEGNGLFGSPDKLQFGNSVQYLGFKDVNGDNILDLTGTFDPSKRELFIALGEEFGGFGVTTSYSFTSNPTNLSLVDIDENGILDLVSISPDESEVTLFLTYEPDGSAATTTVKRTYTR